MVALYEYTRPSKTPGDSRARFFVWLIQILKAGGDSDRGCSDYATSHTPPVAWPNPQRGHTSHKS